MNAMFGFANGMIPPIYAMGSHGQLVLCHPSGEPVIAPMPVVANPYKAPGMHSIDGPSFVYRDGMYTTYFGGSVDTPKKDDDEIEYARPDGPCIIGFS